MTIDFTGNPADKSGEASLKPGDSNSNSDDTSVVVEHKGRKYTKDDLLKKLDSADGFIETLKSEREADRQALEDLKVEMRKSSDVAELLKQLKEKTPPVDNRSELPVVNKDDIIKEVKDSLSRERAQEQVNSQRDSNWKAVTSQLTKAFGTKTQDKAEKVAEANGLTLDEAKELAMTKPAVFLALFPEIKKSEIKSVLPGPSNGVDFQSNKQTNKPVGWEGKNTKERVAAYKSRLEEFSPSQ